MVGHAIQTKERPTNFSKVSGQGLSRSLRTRGIRVHWRLLREVLERLQIAGLKISLEKSEWLRKKVQYLGYVIGQGVLKMDPAKTGDILKIPLPL